MSLDVDIALIPDDSNNDDNSSALSIQQNKTPTDNKIVDNVSETEKGNPMSVISPIIAVAPVPVEWVTPDSQMTPSSKTDTIHSTIINGNILRIYGPKWKIMLLIQWILQYRPFKKFLLLQ